MKKFKRNSRILSWLLAVVLTLGSFSVPVQAAEVSETPAVTAEAGSPKEGQEAQKTDETETTEAEADKSDETQPGETEPKEDEPVTAEDNLLFGEADEAEQYEEAGFYSGVRDIKGPTMEITDYCFGTGFTEYDTYYYADGITYTYKGEEAEFISESEISVGGKTYSLKNKKTEITVETDETGKTSISLSELVRPVEAIPNEWNPSFGGVTQAVYQTDIPGMEEVRTAEKDNLTFPLVLENVPSGTWHLTYGTIYERANSFSPGHDFKDGNGKVKEREFGVLPDVTFTVGENGEEEEEDVYLGVKTEAKVYDDFENDIWLQYQQKELKTGETADLYPWRLEQIVTDTIHNDVARPEFHFDIISGDSISLDTDKSSEKAVVTAKKPGSSVVKVTYEARDYKDKHWDAVSDVNTAYAVFTVGEDGTAVIETNEEFKNWRHYDTIYYTEGETTPYTFTVKTQGAESVKVTVNGMTISGDGDTYTADLENRSNIIGIRTKDADGRVKSMYRVIDARYMQVQVENKSHPGDELKAGDTAKISFKGVTMPVYKLATIYNPQFGGGTWIEYRNTELGDFKGKCNQWDLATKNDFEATFNQEGDYLFYSENGIRSAWWGDKLGSDMTKQGVGKENTNANTVTDYFSYLPDFTISVAEPDAGSIDGKRVTEIIGELPDTADMTLRDKRAVESARKLYERLSEQEKKNVENLAGLEEAEAKIQELMEAPFIFSSDRKILDTVKGKANDRGGYYYEVSVPDSTDSVSLERYKEMSVLNKAGEVLYADGTASVDVKGIKTGEENYIVLKEKDSDVSHYVYFVTKIGFSVSPEVICPGTEVTVTLRNIPALKAVSNVQELYTKYETDIPGCETIQSKDARSDEGKLSVIQFTVPKDTKVGDYHLSNGFVYRYYTVMMGQPRPVTQEFYKGEMPEITIKVTDEDHIAAEAVIKQIDALGEITSLAREPEVVLARENYDALTKEQQELVTNLEVLEKAEAKIEDLKQIPEEGGYVTVDIERFSIGQGFYREPVKVPFEAGDTVKDILESIEKENLLYNEAGTYLAGIKGGDAKTGVKVPDYISQVLGGPTTEEAEKRGNADDVLGEFDYSQGSGWFYFVNNIDPQKGIAEYYVRPNDVIRVQFTLLWGSDLTGKYFDSTEEPAVAISDKDEAIRLLAEVNVRKDREKLLADKDIKEAYDAVVELVQDAVTSQKSIDDAVKALEAALEKGPQEPNEPDEPDKPGEPTEADKEAAKAVEEKIAAIGKVTLLSKTAIENARKAYDALTGEQKKLVENYRVLLDAEKAFAQLKPEEDNKNPDKEDETVTLLNKKYGVVLRGEGLTEDMELVITPLDKEDEDVVRMRKEIPSAKALFRLFDIKLLKNGEETELPGKAELSIPVGDKYDDKELEVLHCEGKEVESLKGKVSGGLVQVEVTSLGSFGVVVDMPGTDGSDAGDGSASGNGAAGGNGSAGGNVKTGDETPFGLLLLMLAVSAAVIAAPKYRKHTK